MTKPSAPPRQSRKRAAVKIDRTATRGKPVAAKIERQPAIRSSRSRLASVVASSSGSNDYSLGRIDDDLRSTATSRFRFPAVSDASGDLPPPKSLPRRCRCSLCNSNEDRISQNSLMSTAAFPPPPAYEPDPSYEEDPSEYEPAEEAAPPVEDEEDPSEYEPPAEEAAPPVEDEEDPSEYEPAEEAAPPVEDEEDPSEYEPAEEAAAPPVEEEEDLKPASWLPPPVSPIQASFTGDSWCYYDFDYYMC